MFSLGLVLYIVITVGMKKFSSQGWFCKVCHLTGEKYGHHNFYLREEQTTKMIHKIAILMIMAILLTLFERQ